MLLYCVDNKQGIVEIRLHFNLIATGQERAMFDYCLSFLKSITVSPGE